MSNPLKPWSKAPGEYDQSHQDWLTSAVNQLLGQAFPTAGSGFTSLNPPRVNPSTSQVTSIGSRTQSITTAIKVVSTSGGVSFFWDGTNGSVPFQVYRDDGTFTAAVKANLVVTGLTASTTYFFYPYFDETVSLIKFVNNANVSGGVGSPAVAYTAQNILCLQQQLLRTHLPLAVLLATAGVATQAIGNPPVTSSGGAGGGGGSSYGGHALL